MSFSFTKVIFLVIFTILSCLISLSFSPAVKAHQLGTSYLNLEYNQQNHQYKGKWELQISDLEQQIAFELDEDNQVSWYEIKSKTEAINAFLEESISFTQGRNVCSLGDVGSYRINHYYNEAYLVIPVVYQCANDSAINITYDAFVNIDNQHQAMVNVDNVNKIFTSENRSQRVNVKNPDSMTTFIQYVYQGILHIWMGVDHVLFLITLLLTSVLIRHKAVWQGEPSKLAIFKKTAWIITAFTLAHSITLTATALNFLSFSSRWVELGIAFSVLLAAVNNVWPLILRLGWITFGFGLLHGMGFASVLQDLGLSEDFQLLSILAFNLGVELGQLAILIVALPLLIWARKFVWYKKWAMPIGSLAIAAVALIWCIERF